MKFNLKVMGAIVALASMLTGCAGMNPHLQSGLSLGNQARGNGHSLKTDDHKAPTPGTMAEAGLVSNPDTLFIPAKFVRGNHDPRANALFIKGKRVSSSVTDQAFVQGFIPAPYGYMVVMDRWGVDCQGRHIKDGGSTTFLKYSKGGDKVGQLACRPMAWGDQFTPKGVWFAQVGTHDWYFMDAQGKVHAGPAGASELMAMANGNAFYTIGHANSGSKTVKYIWDTKTRTPKVSGYMGYGWTLSGLGKQEMESIFVNEPTYAPSVMSGWGSVTAEYSQCTGNSLCDNHSDDEFFDPTKPQNTNKSDRLFWFGGSKMEFTYKNGDNTYLVYETYQANLTSRPSPAEFRVQCLQGPACPGGADSVGWNLPFAEKAPVGSSYGKQYPMANTFHGYAYLIRTPKSTVLVTRRSLDDDQKTGGWGFILNNPSAVKTLTHGQMADYFDVIGLKPLENFAQQY